MNLEDFVRRGQAAQKAVDCIIENQAFLAEVERRAGATREGMLQIMHEWEGGYEPWASNGIAPHVVRWLRRILGEEKP